MREIATQDPGLYTILARKDVKIWTDAKPLSADDPTLGQLPNGLYLHVTVGGKPISEKEVVDSFVDLYRGTPDNKALALAKALLPGLHVENDPSLLALMAAADTARMQYAGDEMKRRMNASDPDIKGALSFFTSQSDGFFSDGAREAFWKSSGEPYFSQRYFSDEFKKLLQDTREQPTSGNMRNFTGVKADRIGRYIEDILRIAPNHHVAGAILDAVKGTFNDEWSRPNFHARANQYFKDFYKGLSWAVELNPKRADEFAGWLTDVSGPQGKMLSQFWNAPHSNFGSVYDAALAGHGRLSEAVIQAVDKSPSFKDPSFERLKDFFKGSFDHASAELTEDYEKKITDQEYRDFMQAPERVLTPFFQNFQRDPKIGHGIVYQNDTEWDNIIGRTLGLPPNAPGGQEAFAANDYARPWYLPGTPQGNVIKLVKDWFHDQGAEGKKVTALPSKYASPRAGLHNTGIFLIDSAAGHDDPSNQKVIDGEAAIEAVYMNGGHEADANNVTRQWHYDNFAQFQTTNNYERNGYIYLAGLPKLNGYNNDGKTLPGGYQQFTARIKTPGEYAKDGGRIVLTGIGVAGMFTGQWYAAPLVLASGVGNAGISAYDLYQMRSHGAAIFNTANDAAMQEWLAIGGTVFAATRFGLLSRWGAGTGPRFVRAAAAFSGFGATYIGLKQTAAGVVSTAQTWSDPHASLGDVFWSTANTAMGVVTITAGGLRVGMPPPPEIGPAGFGFPARGSAIIRPGNIPARFRTWWTQATGNTGILNSTPYRNFGQTFLYGLGRVGGAYAIANVAGVPFWAAANWGRNDRRTTAPITAANAEAEMAALLNDPAKYVARNYESTLFGMNRPWAYAGIDEGLEGDAHLKVLYRGPNAPEYFIRLPHELRERLKNEALQREEERRRGSPAPAPVDRRPLPAEAPVPAPPAEIPAQEPRPDEAKPPATPLRRPIPLPRPRPPAQPERRRHRVTRLRRRRAAPASAPASRPIRGPAVPAGDRHRSGTGPHRTEAPSARRRLRRHRRRGEGELDRLATGAIAQADTPPLVRVRLDAAAPAVQVAALNTRAPAPLTVAAAPAVPRPAAPQPPPHSAAPDAAKPSVMEPASAHLTQPFIEGDKLFTYTRVDLDKTGVYGTSTPDINLKDPAPEMLRQLQDNVKQAIGVYGFRSYLASYKPPGMQGAHVWDQALQNFQGRTGAGAYDAWVKANRPDGGDDVYWKQARDAFKSQLDARANELWNAAGKPRGGPTAAQREQAEREYGPQIATRAFERWLPDGRKAGTAGADEWIKGEPALEEETGKLAFDTWVEKGAKVNGADAGWRDALFKWKEAGRPIVAKVEIREPFRYEGNRDGWIFTRVTNKSGGSRNRGTLGWGQIDGARLHANFDLTLFYPYNAPTTTTFRVGLPYIRAATNTSPAKSTRVFDADIRQQNTTFVARVTGGLGFWEWNGGATGTQVYDLTNGTQDSWTFMNGRFYLDSGYRDRSQIQLLNQRLVELNHKALKDPKINSWFQFVRERETGMVELGLGLDGLKINSGPRTFNANAYYELQLYTGGDYRNEIRLPGFNVRQFTGTPVTLLVDPALQLSWSGYVPGLSPDGGDPLPWPIRVLILPTSGQVR
jgi:hypothetical protein